MHEAKYSLLSARTTFNITAVINQKLSGVLYTWFYNINSSKTSIIQSLFLQRKLEFKIPNFLITKNFFQRCEIRGFTTENIRVTVFRNVIHILLPGRWRQDIRLIPRSAATVNMFNPLKPELNPICYLLALLGTHHFFHVSGLRVNLLKPTRNFTCQKVHHSKILHFDQMEFVCFVWIWERTVNLALQNIKGMVFL